MINIFKKGYRTLTTDIDTWVVRWNKRYGEFHCDIEMAAQFFTSREEAEAFADSLKKAIKLLGHMSNELTWVKCEKVKNKGI